MKPTFTPLKPLQTAVLFLVFNRPDTTKQVFEAIRKAKPPRLYVAADGPRTNLAGEAKKVAEVREIASAVDWDCEVRTLFRKENLGCKSAVSTGITWFFEHEELGIILEDDCLPTQSFFWFCEQMLQQYKEDGSIGMISGNNLYDQDENRESSYYFSIHGGIWGWASWARVWKTHISQKTVNMSRTADQALKKILTNKQHRKFYINQLMKVESGEINSWAIPFSYMRYINRLYCIRPKINLVSNIGLEHPDATHTKTKLPESLKNERRDIAFPLRPPNGIFADSKADDRLAGKQFKKKSLLLRVKDKLTIYMKGIIKRVS